MWFAIFPDGITPVGFTILASAWEILWARSNSQRRPIARPQLSQVEARRECPALAASFTLYIWYLQMEQALHDRLRYKIAIPLCTPPCLACGAPTGCFCDICSKAVCTKCDKTDEGKCLLCRNGPCSAANYAKRDALRRAVSDSRRVATAGRGLLGDPADLVCDDLRVLGFWQNTTEEAD